jgi:hypothetical protein
MNTITASMDEPKNIYWPRSLGETPLINQRQKEKLTALIYQNITDENERELRLSELEDLTEADADYALFQFSQGIWS